MARVISTSLALLSCAWGWAQGDPIVKSPRLKRTLASGAKAIVERTDGPRVSIQLFCASQGIDTGVEASGWRHVIEHILARGEKDDFDLRLESIGGYLVANTARDATRFEIVVPASQFELGIGVLGELLQPRTFTRTILEKELPILRQEAILTHSARDPFYSAWSAAYDGKRPDPLGTPLGWASLSPSAATLLDRELKSGRRVTISVAGPVDLDRVMNRLEPLTANLTQDEPLSITTPAPTDVPSKGSRDFVAARHASWADTKSWARLVAAHGLRIVDRELQVSYTPAAKSGLVTITGSATEDWKEFRERAEERRSEVRADGRLLTQRWLLGLRATTSEIATSNGYLLAQSGSISVAQALELVQGLSDAELDTAISEWLGATRGEVLP